MYGLAVIVIMSLSGHLTNIDEMVFRYSFLLPFLRRLVVCRNLSIERGGLARLTSICIYNVDWTVKNANGVYG